MHTLIKKVQRYAFKPDKVIIDGSLNIHKHFLNCNAEIISVSYI